jgi:FKBP-type peptidyl-prolyl cis-trans isomerase SlyD
MIENGKKISVEYTLTLEDGIVADSNVGGEPLVYEQGSQTILPALERALEGMKVDETRQVTLSAADGYGEIDPQKYMKVAKDRVPPEGREIGQVLTVSDQQGRSQMVRVVEEQGEMLVLDFNHPLAGQALHFEVKVLGIE